MPVARTDETKLSIAKHTAQGFKVDFTGPLTNAGVDVLRLNPVRLPLTDLVARHGYALSVLATLSTGGLTADYPVRVYL